jgi:hypothetical protein
MRNVPEWLAIVRIAFWALTIIMAFGYPMFKQEDRDSHKVAIDEFIKKIERGEIGLFVIIQSASKFSSYIFDKIYGYGSKMAITSFLLTTIYILVAVSVSYSWVSGLGNYSAVKAQLDMNVDPSYIYSSEQISRAKEGRVVGFKDTAYWKYTYYDNEAAAIREAFDNREQRWFEALKGRPDAEELSILTLWNGFEWEPGPRWFLITTTVLFTALFDFLCVNYCPLVVEIHFKLQPALGSNFVDCLANRCCCCLLRMFSHSF